ncbi:MAG: toxic anion resistance protein [Rhodospirillales bacterium]
MPGTGSFDQKTQANIGGAEATTAASGDLDYRRGDPALRRRIDDAIAEIDLGDANSVLFFGTKAQQDLTTVSDEMLEGVRNKDVGPAGSALSEMLAAIRGFDIGELDPNRARGLLGRVLGTGKPVAKILQRYEEVRGQIDAIGDRLETHKGSLLRDVALLDRLYAKTLAYFHGLATYIAAGDEQLRRLDEGTIPALEAQVGSTGNVVKAQELRDLRAVRDDLERRVHDLKLTRQVAMQSLPSIRLVQENDKSLVAKITSVMANTVPLWRQQLAQAVTIHRSREAGRTLKEATDLTNSLLLANAENLRQANAEVRRQAERGVFDIEAVKKANELLIATVEDSLRIADEAKQKRAAAESELAACETKLRETLAAARSPDLPRPPSESGR